MRGGLLDNEVVHLAPDGVLRFYDLIELFYLAQPNILIQRSQQSGAI